jgi:uncharacterized protein YjiS (DUF1127 family)
MTIASANELDVQTTADLKPARVSRKDMWLHTGNATADRTAMEGPGAWPSHDYALAGNAPRSSWWQHAALLIARTIRGIAEAQRRADERHLLSSLDDRTLADMGLLRSEIKHAVKHGHPRRRRPN